MLHTEPSNSGIPLLAIMEASADSFGTLAERLDGNRGTVMKDEYHNKNIMDTVEVMYKTKGKCILCSCRGHSSNSTNSKSAITYAPIRTSFLKTFKFSDNFEYILY